MVLRRDSHGGRNIGEAQGTTSLPTFPEVRAWVREIVATLYFVETPRLMKLALSFLRDPPAILRRAAT